MSQQQNQPPQNRPQSPLSRPFGSGQAASNASGARPNTASASPNPPASGSRLGGLPRFGANRANWRIVSVTNVVVRFDLDGLGDPFHRLLGAPLAAEYGDYEQAIKAIETGGPLVKELEAVLENTWQDYKLLGAVLLYPWRKELPQAMVGRVSEADEEDEEYEDEKPSPPVFLRALDLRLVMNVLARTRSNILLSRAPLGLEQQYLGQSLFTDDSRLVLLARATGCIEEAVLK